MKEHDKNKEMSYFKYWNVNTLMDGTCHMSFQ